MDDQLKSNLTSSKHWVRLIYMILFAIAMYVAFLVMMVLVAAQFLFALVTGRDNLQLRKFGDSLSLYMFKTLQYLIYKEEEKPFPFADWPESDVVIEDDAEEVVAEDVEEKPETKPPAKKAAPKRKASPKKKAEEAKDPPEE